MNVLGKETLKKFLSSNWTIGIFLFIVAAAIRAIPEIKAGVWPIGYDTFNTYAAELATYHGPLINWLKTANLLYFFFLPFKLAGMSPDLIMKVFGPLVYGGLITTFFIFARRFLRFSPLKAFILAFLTIFQLAALRISWDLYRNELGLIFLFLGLIQLPKISQTKNLVFFSVLSVLVALSNELVTVLLLVILLVTAIYHLIKSHWEELVSTLIPFVIVLILFLIVIRSSGQALYDQRILFTTDKNYFWYYFYHYNLEMPFSLLKSIILGLFWLLYGYILFFVVFGIWSLRKNLVLLSLTGFLLFGTFSSLIFGGNGLMVWERWMFMLVFPFIIYAVEGSYFIGSLFLKIKFFTNRIFHLSVAVIFWLAVFGFFFSRAWPFLTADYDQAKPPFINEELNNYFPRTMVHNSLGLRLIPDTIAVVDWLNAHAPAGSVILVDNRYRGVMLTRFNIDDRFIITNSWSETVNSSTLEVARKSNYWPIYLIWNVSRTIPNFDRVYSVGDRGVYEALPSFLGP